MLGRCLMMVMLLMLLTCSPSALQAAPQPNDREALAGLKTAKVIFDVRVGDLDKLVLNLQLFSETMEGIAAQGVKPEMIVTFRGPAVKLLTAAALDGEARDLLRTLKKRVYSLRHAPWPCVYLTLTRRDLSRRSSWLPMCSIL